MANKVDTSKMTRKQREAYEAQQRMKKAMIIAAAAIVLFIAIIGIIYYAMNHESADTVATSGSATDSSVEFTAAGASEYATENDPIVTMTMADGSQVVLQLYPAAAPNTVANFVELAQSGYYDGLTFHRVISGFMVQGGDPEGTGMGGPGYSIKGEFATNGVENNLSHTRGVISMARSMMPDSAGSQFFIMHADTSSLDGQYAAFGEVISGIEVIDAIAAVATDASDKPVEDVVIESITVDTKGIEYKAEKIGE